MDESGGEPLHHRSQACGANVKPLGFTVNGYFVSVNIRLERARRARRLALPASGVLVADVAAETGPLWTEIALTRHRSSLKSFVRPRALSK